MRTRCLPILLFAVLVLSSCDNNDSARPVDPPAPTTDEMIIADCYVVRDALEAFAAANGGVYPSEVAAVVPFLPGSSLLTNRYTGLATVPVLHEPQWPGEIGVVVFSDTLAPWSLDPPVGYQVVGRGRTGELVRLENLSAIPPAVIAKYDSIAANCVDVVRALEQYAQVAGHYPADVGADALPSGDVLSDLLTGGELLMNPVFQVADSPADGDPTGVAGQIGYVAIGTSFVQDVDYLVVAMGETLTPFVVRRRYSPEDGYARIFAWELRRAVETFASQNGGEYPHDVDTDLAPSGKTVKGLMPYGYTNPYTSAPGIRNGLAASRGEVGYAPVESDGVVVGYVINALGLFNVKLERFEVLTN